MKKFWLLTTLLVAWLLLTGCNKTAVENPEIIDDCITVDWEYKCAVDTEEPIVDEPIEDCNRYFDGCNRCTKQDDWERICTEEACEQYQETYCADEQYDKFLEDLQKNELELYHNAQYGIQLWLSEELSWGKIIEIERDRDDIFPHHLIIFMAKDDTATADETYETWIDWYREKFTIWVVPVEYYEDAMIDFSEDNILWKNNKYYFFESKPDPLDTNYYYTNMFVENVK